MNSLVSPVEQMRSHYDVVLVGSGYGGGVAASRLSRMGLSVCVLEKGEEWRPGDFDNSGMALAKRTRFSSSLFSIGKKNALFQFHAGKQMHVLTGCGLGGGSLVNAGLAFRPQNWVFEQENWPREITTDKLLNKGFERAEKMLGVSHCPAGEQLLKYKSLQACATALGQGEAETVASTINYQPRINNANVMQSACTQCGDCWMGCNVGAKNTVAITYLADAAAHGAELFTGMNVSHIRRLNELEQQRPGLEGKWQVLFQHMDGQSGKGTWKGTLTCDTLILSAGVFGTTEILLRSREHGLALSERLGKGFSANGDELVFGHDLPLEVNGIAVGHPSNGKTEEPVGPNCIGMISLPDDNNPRDSIAIQAGTMMPLMAALAPLKNLMRGRLLRAFKIMMSGAYKGILTHSQCFYVVGHDDAGGELALEKERLLLDWPDVAEQSVFARSKEAVVNMLERQGAEFMQNPLRDTILGGKLISVHPLGGCAMGENAGEGVVDHACRVFDGETGQGVYEGLLVVDGSIIPTSLGANPLLTISALSERAMILLARDRKLEFDSQPKKDAPLRDVFM